MSLQPLITFDRSSGRLDGASMIERLSACALQAGSKASALYHRRGFSVGCRALRGLIGERDIVVQLNDEARFAFPLGDGYWSLLLDRSFVYEDDIDRVLTSVADVDYGFVDCGANFGFWSVLASSPRYGGHPVLAVEPSRSNYQKLVRNAGLNGGRFETLHRAIGATRGHAWLQGHKHEALRIAPTGEPSTGEQVEVVTLDDLIDRHPVAAQSRLIVKLDVEGMEVAAIKGAKRLSERDVLLMVEDHGSDRAHTVSRYILEQTPFRIFVFDPRANRFAALADVSMLDRIKTNLWEGYNIFATNSPFWQDRLNRLSPALSASRRDDRARAA